MAPAANLLATLNLENNIEYGVQPRSLFINLATLTSNQKGFVPILDKVRPLKSLNQFYNKTKAKLQSQLRGRKKTSKRIQKLTAKRNNRVDTYLHQASRWIIDYLDYRGIGQLIIGQNPFWKAVAL